MLTTGVFSQTPRLVGALGMPVVVNEPAAATLTVNGKSVPVRSATIADALSPVPVGRSDPRWVWLTGAPAAPGWRETTDQPPGAFEVRWADPLTKAEFDSVKLSSADGKPLPADKGASVWLDAVTPGWEALSRAALSVIGEFPQDEREAVAAALRTPLATPGDHWRSALLLRAINPSASAPADFQPAALNAVARQQGDMWAGAIGRLSRVDAALGQQVARRLVQVAYFPTSNTSGAWGVLWCEADPRLLDTLITAPGPELTTAASSFLAGQPQALAWVRDDAGLRDPFAGAPLATVGVVSMGDKAAVATLSFGGPAPEPIPLKPLIGQFLTASDSRPVDRQRAGGGAVLKVGQTSLSLPIASARVPAAPPGVLIGPFFRDWTLRTFRRQQPTVVGGVAGSLLPSADGGGWTLYLERRGDSGEDLEPERFRVWAGPTGAPVVSVDVTPDGTAASRLGNQTPAPATAVSRIPGGWCATIQLPASAVDASGTLRLGVEHVPASGMRSCWPRPMMPWQTEPGRTAIDAAAWDRELKPR